jgi:recombination protein RecA
MVSPTEYLTLNTCEWTDTQGLSLNSDGVCSLSDILETGDVPQRFFLSPKACKGIIRRAVKRGKPLPPHLAPVLQRVADSAPTSTSTAASHSTRKEKTMIERVASQRESGGLYFARPNKTRKFISTGAKILDLIMGGGWARGRVGNVYGDTSTGKTLLMIEACRNFADSCPKGKIRYREFEDAFDVPYAKALGLPSSRIDFGSESLDTVEDMFEDLEDICSKATTPELYIVDSLDALAHRAELNRKIGKASYGGEKAKVMSQMFRTVVRLMGEKDVTLLIVSQLRDTFARFGKTKKPGGGKALPYYSSQQMALVQTGVIRRTMRGIERPVGINVKAKMDKNKVGLPFREAAFDIMFGFGIDDARACVRFLETTGFLKDIDLEKKKVSLYLQQLEHMNRADYNLELKDLREAVDRRWYQIEEGFLPKRSKYT